MVMQEAYEKVAAATQTGDDPEVAIWIDEARGVLDGKDREWLPILGEQLLPGTAREVREEAEVADRANREDVAADTKQKEESERQKDFEVMRVNLASELTMGTITFEDFQSRSEVLEKLASGAIGTQVSMISDDQTLRGDDVPHGEEEQDGPGDEEDEEQVVMVVDREGHEIDAVRVEKRKRAGSGEKAQEEPEKVSPLRFVFELSLTSDSAIVALA
jgi:hypothetical protein